MEVNGKFKLIYPTKYADIFELIDLININENNIEDFQISKDFKTIALRAMLSYMGSAIVLKNELSFIFPLLLT